MRLSDLLVRSAVAFPERPAIQDRRVIWDYQQLHSFSDVIASKLLAITGMQKQRIGIYMDKAPETIAAIFGVLKSGACYVPLDPAAPPERLKLIIQDCGLAVLITSVHKQSVLPQLLQQGSTIRLLLFVDCSEPDKIDSWPVTTLALGPSQYSPVGCLEYPAFDESALAYILYTSGSTGQPKGVMISHRAAWAFVEWTAGLLQLSESDRFVSNAPFHFDLSIFDIYAAILHGGCLCLIPSGLAVFPKSLADFVEKESITVWYSVPSTLVQLVLHGRLEQRRLQKLKYIIFAGEVFPTKYLTELMRQVPGPEYFNWYGPTETNVCTYHRVREAPAEGKTVPIGGLCAGQTCYIVDESKRLCASEEVGELWVHGPTLMEGYWNDPEKTSRSLIDDPFSSNAIKVYRTGDLVCWNSKGELEYHGRADHMIKTRGYRVEIGEIESVLHKLPEVYEAAVVGVPDEQIGKRIKAVLSLKPGSQITEMQIKQSCAQYLPAYMVPDFIEIVADLPHTSTNKIDRNSLEKGA